MDNKEFPTDDAVLEDYLAVDVPVVLDLDPLQRKHTRYRTSFRGWLADSFMLLDLPSSEALRSSLWRGQDCIVRFVTNGVACGCTCTVVEWSQSRTFSYIRTTWPSTFERQQVRQHERVDLTIPCAIAAADGVVDKGVLRDLSVGGCCVEAQFKGAIERGASVRLSFELPDGTALNDAHAEVCSLNQASGDQRVGCRFTDLPPESRQDLEFYISSMVSRMRGGKTDNAGKRVLIIEPHPEVVKRLCSRLNSEMFAVHVESCIMEAGYRLRAHRPDVVLINAECEVDSYALCKQIRRTRGMEHVPLFAYVDKITQEDADPAPLKAAGATDYCPLESVPDSFVDRIFASVGAAR